MLFCKVLYLHHKFTGSPPKRYKNSCIYNVIVEKRKHLLCINTFLRSSTKTSSNKPKSQSPTRCLTTSYSCTVLSRWTLKSKHCINDSLSITHYNKDTEQFKLLTFSPIIKMSNLYPETLVLQQLLIGNLISQNGLRRHRKSPRFFFTIHHNSSSLLSLLFNIPIMEEPCYTVQTKEF